ncbi:hypothetical protein PR048_005613 [Dryococelus australis]|uniref:Uncharacterized protein n=1 Tax=Dryococelus australis TaxID=614101 RepID=A0ABQ9I985_9NEOP|nr:hypothetical protein PR048_005613 [Dryococelus australis]
MFDVAWITVWTSLRTSRCRWKAVLLTRELQNGVVQGRPNKTDRYLQTKKTVIWNSENPNHFNKSIKQDAWKTSEPKLIEM